MSHFHRFDCADDLALLFSLPPSHCAIKLFLPNTGTSLKFFSAHAYVIVVSQHLRSQHVTSHRITTAMKMYFESSCEVTILFQGWTTTNCTQYFFSWLVVAIVCILRHFLHDFRMSVLAKKATSMPTQGQHTACACLLCATCNH